LLSDDKKLQDRIMKCAIKTAMALCDLLDAKKDTENQSNVDSSSSSVSLAINELLEAIKLLPDAIDLSLDQDVTELENEVERELFNCSSFIKESLQSLLNESKKNIKGDVDLVKAIVSSTTAITRATEKLVDMAISTNKKRREKKGPQSQIDPTIANGIIESTKSVITAIENLIQSAISSVNGKIDEESLVNFSRAVAAATAQLVKATRAKTDVETQNLLSNAAKAVANATSQLVSALQRVTSIIEGGVDDFTDLGEEQGDRTKELQQQMRILKLERELERERRRMQKMNKVVS